jgi:hypothetical protein
MKFGDILKRHKEREAEFEEVSKDWNVREAEMLNEDEADWQAAQNEYDVQNPREGAS